MRRFLSGLLHAFGSIPGYAFFAIFIQVNALADTPAANLTGKLFYSTYQLDLSTGLRKELLGVSKYFGVSEDGGVFATIKHAPKKLRLVTAAGQLEAEFDIKSPSPVSVIKFSPSGQKLVYQEDPYGSVYKLHVVQRNNGKLIVTLDINAIPTSGSYDWVDENRLVVAKEDNFIMVDIAASERAGQLRGTPLTSKPLISNVFMPAVQPGGKKMAFQMDYHIWMINTDGTQLKQATTSRFKETAVTFSPDGQYLAVGESTSFIYYQFDEVWVMPSQAENVWLGLGKPTQAVRATEMFNGQQKDISGSTLAWRS